MASTPPGVRRVVEYFGLQSVFFAKERDQADAARDAEIAALKAEVARLHALLDDRA